VVFGIILILNITHYTKKYENNSKSFENHVFYKLSNNFTGLSLNINLRCIEIILPTGTNSFFADTLWSS